MPTTKLGRFTIHFAHAEEFRRLKSEIFTHDTYFFESDTLSPLIIDAGAHIGMATLYFKQLFPLSRVISLEPHPDNFVLLEKNVYENTLDDVEILNTALATNDELITLHEDRTSEKWFSSASLLPGAWNGQQDTQPLTVPALTLSTLLANLDRPVDLLKLDIEGAELAVLRAAQADLSQIKHIILEYHPHQQNPLSELLELLEKAGFSRVTGYKDHGQIDLEKPPRGLLMIEAKRPTTETTGTP